MSDNDEAVVSYFESIGYKTSWDRCGGLKYHEIIDQKGNLIMQVDMGIPVEAIKQDLIKEREGIGEGSEFDYMINGGGPEFDELLKIII